MREIKFRVWDKQENTWHSGRWCNISNSAKTFALTSQDTEDSGFEVQQFTGLKDSKGREIYEGDILTGYEGNDYKWAVKYGSFNCGCCSWVYGWDFDRIEVEKAIIVGNIFENPELINEKIN